jgi:CheY-like chemotaxis protein
MGFKVLVVDDDPDNVSYLKDILEDNGFTTLSARDGMEGLEKAREALPDLILLDLMMPQKSGIRMFQELKGDAGTRDIPVVIVSGVSLATGVDFRNFLVKPQPVGGEEAAAPAVSSQYNSPAGFVEKPIDPDELLRAVKKALQGNDG